VSRLRRAFHDWARSAMAPTGAERDASRTMMQDAIREVREAASQLGQSGDDGDPVSDALVAPVQTFVIEVGQALDELAGRAGRTQATAREDVALEAAAIAAGVMDSDVSMTDDELRAYLVALGPLLFATSYSNPAELRASGILHGKRTFLHQPSPLFELLVDADTVDGGQRAWRYYRAAMDLAHVAASLDLHTSQAELELIGRFRATLLARIRYAGIARPDNAFFGLGAGDLTGGSPRAMAPPPQAAGAPPVEAPTAEATEAATTEDEQIIELPPARPLQELLDELDQLIGLDGVKDEVKRVTDLLVVQRLREERGLPSHGQSSHLVFTGNPGTGKTTVARLLAEIYRTLGVIEIGHLVETDRSHLVAGFVGQTAERTTKVVEGALDGILLIDEAYALARGGEKDFGREAIDTLVKLMEDYRERLVVIVAGYPNEMGTLIDANPGLQSRFPRTIYFPDYTDDELVAILGLISDSRHYELAPEALDAARSWFAAVHRDRGFGNGRLARNLLEAAIARHASRLVLIKDPTNEQLLMLVAEDLAGVELPS
jgi:AAA+ superfamily predicted ATPase